MNPLSASDQTAQGEQQAQSAWHHERGDWLAAKGAIEDALEAHRAGLMLVEQLVEQEPKSVAWQRDLMLSYNQVGDRLTAEGHRAEALRTYRAGLVIAEQLAAMNPADTERQWELSISYNKVGDSLADNGCGMDALLSYRAALAIREQLAEQDETDVRWQTELIASYWKIAQINLKVRQDQTETAALLSLGLAYLNRLKSQFGLAPEQEGWIPAFEQALEHAQAPPESGLLMSARAMWRKFTPWGREVMS